MSKLREGEEIEWRANEAFTDMLVHQIQLDELREDTEVAMKQLNDTTSQGTDGQRRLDAINGQTEQVTKTAECLERRAAKS